MLKIDSYHDPYANLAAAIIRAAEQDNDIVFLNSDWCDTLKLLCKLDSELFDKTNKPISIGPSAKLLPGD